ncbi:MAG TPA: DegV family protein [Candidatus Limiplasma sp.]|nr:DegV family protein [Candidatus Limiplasma sp.]
METETKTAVITDSSCDLSDEQLQRYNIRMISLRIITQNAEYRDRIDLSQDQIYDIMDGDLPKTSLPLPEDIHAVYEQLIAQGYTDAVHLCISSGLSGTWNMIRILAEEYKNKINIHIVDSKTLSTGLGFMVLAAAEALEAGATPEQAVQAAQTVRSTQLGMFVIRTLEYLRKGGRIGLVEGVVGSLLQIKPIVYVNDDGVYETLAKARGYKAAKETMIHEAVKRFGKTKINLSVVHGQANEEALTLLDRLKQVLNVATTMISPVSPVLAIHTGRGLLGIIAYAAE